MSTRKKKKKIMIELSRPVEQYYQKSRINIQKKKDISFGHRAAMLKG